MPDEPAIFISYRRSDAGGHGRALHEYLSGRFGDDRVFFDRRTIESGDVFPDRLRRGVEGCAVLLALIGPEWLDARGDDGSRRLDDPEDFVRREIALALERGKKVIPVLFEDIPFPPRARLPDPLKALASCDALALRGKTYEYRTQRRELVRLLARVPGVPQPLPEAGEAVAAIPADLPEIIKAVTGPLQQLNQEQRETIRVLERQLGASEAQLRAFFQVIGEAQLPPKQQPARLAEIAEQYRQLRAQVAALPGDAPVVARLKDAARVALEAGRLQQADDLLVQVEAAQDAVLDRQQLLLPEQAIRYYTCFISYSSKDEAFAERLHADLENTGVRCWFAPHDLPIGAKTWDAIDEAIRFRDKLLLILSKNAIASDWVGDEVSKAYAEEKRRNRLVLFPVRIDEEVMNTSEPWAVKLRDQRNIGDFRRWQDHEAYQQAFKRVLRDLEAAHG
jgi:hypothetical protein